MICRTIIPNCCVQIFESVNRSHLQSRWRLSSSFHKGALGAELTDIVRILPAVPDLQIVVLNNQSGEPFDQMGALRLGQAIDPLDVVPDSIHSLPSSHGICPNHRMHGRQLGSGVLRGPSRLAVDFKILFLGRLRVSGLGVVGRQSFEELLVRLGNSVKDSVARGPQGVYGLLMSAYRPRILKRTDNTST